MREESTGTQQRSKPRTSRSGLWKSRESENVLEKQKRAKYPRLERATRPPLEAVTFQYQVPAGRLGVTELTVLATDEDPVMVLN